MRLARTGMVNPPMLRLSCTLRESKEVKKTCVEIVVVLKLAKSNCYLVNARAFTQGAGEPQIPGIYRLVSSSRSW